MTKDQITNSQRKTLIIAEGGVNHNRKLETAIELADAAKVAGADVFKLQLEKPTEYCLTYEETLRVYKHCVNIGILFACTAFDGDSLRYLLDNCKMPFIKIASHKWGGNEVISLAHNSDLPLIVSSRDWHDLFRAHVNIPGYWKDITVLHCVGEYPTPIEHANLRRIKELQRLGYIVGLSDHSGDMHIPPLAIAMGATVIECHLTLDQMQDGPDHLSSLEPNQFEQMVKNVELVEKALG